MDRSRIKVLALAALSAAGLLAPFGSAHADICGDLWYQRNAIYHAYGYCFKTAKAIAVFGNAGCIYRSEGAIPMSRIDKQTVLALKQREKALGCL